MKDIRPVKGRYYIEELISQGEHEQQDFKFLISDARKIARSISAFANNGGGRLLELIDSASDRLTVRDISIALHIAMSHAEDLVVRLAALGIIEFRHMGNGIFSLVRP